MDREVYSRMRDVEDRHWWFRGRRSIVIQVLSALKLPADCAILDAGCGTGGNLEVLSTFGVAAGMEADDEAIAFASARQRGSVVKGYLPNGVPDFGRRFDLIALLDVLEHVEHDRDSLASLRTVMKPGGYMLITVPAFSCLWSRHDEIHHHKRRYVRASLKRAIDEAGLQMIRMTYFNTFLFPLIAAVRLKERFFRPADAMQELKVPNTVVNAMLESVLHTERKLLQWMELPFGVSLLAVVKNPG